MQKNPNKSEMSCIVQHNEWGKQFGVTYRSIMYDPSLDESSKDCLTITILTSGQPQTQQLMKRLIRGG